MEYVNTYMDMDMEASEKRSKGGGRMGGTR